MSGLAAAHILVCWVVQLPIAVSDLERKTRIMGISRTDAIFIYARGSSKGRLYLGSGAGNRSRQEEVNGSYGIDALTSNAAIWV